MKKFTLEIRGVIFPVQAISIEHAKNKAVYEYYQRTGIQVLKDEATHHKNKLLTQNQLFDE